jgi:hypothetical protein
VEILLLVGRVLVGRVLVGRVFVGRAKSRPPDLEGSP